MLLRKLAVWSLCLLLIPAGFPQSTSINGVPSQSVSGVTSLVPALSPAQIAGSADSYATIQAAFTAAQTGCQEVYIPAGTYMTSAGLTYSANCVRVRGAGASSTSITASGTGYNTLTVGNGVGTQGTPTGYVQGLHLIGDGRSNAGYSALQINGLDEFRVVDVTADTADIGFDLINNCFGTQFENIRGGFGGTLNAGMYFRIGTASGSDISIYNPWINGQICGACVGNQVGGLHFYGGQITAGQGTGSLTDTSGAFILGKDYLTSTTGEYNVDVNGTSIEGTTYAWAFRAFTQGHLATNNIGGNPTSSTAPAIGFFKNVNQLNSTTEFIATNLTGYWSNAALIVEGGGYGNNSFIESGTYSAAQNPTINGTPAYVSCMVIQSSLTNGVCINNNNNVSAPAITLSGTTGTQCLQEVAGVLTPTGTDCKSGPFYNPVFQGSASLGAGYVIDNITGFAITGTNYSSITHFLEYSYCSLSSPCTPLTGSFSMIATPGTGVEPAAVLQFASSSFGHPCPTGGCSFAFDNPVGVPALIDTGVTSAPYLGTNSSGQIISVTGPPANITNVTTVVGTTLIAANTCTSATTVTMTGVATTSTFQFTPNADVSGITGWGTTGGLAIDAWPTSDTLNYKVCNQTASNITPSASVTFNVSAK